MKKKQLADNKLQCHLAEYRLVARFPSTALAARVNISRSNLYKIERGLVVPSVITALKLAKTLQVSVEDLFSLEIISDQIQEDKLNDYFGRLLNRQYRFKKRCLIKNK